MNCVEFKKSLHKRNIREIACDDDDNYETWRPIRNTRFDYKPFCIVKCETAKDVGEVIKLCVSQKKPFRVRSGGHHHEGMCSGDNVVVIDLSKMNNICVSKNGTAWIEPGASLGEVYKKLGDSDYTIPGGGCLTVRTGGLVQGGGWGMLARAGGLACDALEEVELVDANGNILTVNEASHQDLFWAIKGGGGGNFGVITNYRFKLMKESSKICLVTVNCPLKSGLKDPKDNLANTLKYYLEYLPNFNRNFTSFARVSPYNNVTTLTMIFKYLGSQEDAENDLKDFLHGLCQNYGTDYEITYRPEKDDDESLTHYEAFLLLNGQIPGRFKSLTSDQSNSEDVSKLLSFSLHPLSQISSQPMTLLGGTTERPTTTCEGQRLPHKVSSAFPKDDISIAEMAKEIVDYIVNHGESEGAATYLSIHSLGGKVKDFDPKQDSSFFYRDKEFLLQLQAWWEDSSDKNKSDKYLKWIKNFREKLKDYIEGAFINFVDREIELKEYYGDNFEQLQEIKHKYDPENVFCFEMSIPKPDSV